MCINGQYIQSPVQTASVITPSRGNINASAVICSFAAFAVALPPAVPASALLPSYLFFEFPLNERPVVYLRIRSVFFPHVDKGSWV